MQNVSKKIDFNNLIYYFKGESGSKKFIGFKSPLGFIINTKDGYTTLEKAEENKKEIKSDLNEVIKGRYKV